ncbi:MAG TPA: hypothetical protein VFQ68_06260 [Streptosporangiaceae bacterium]|nr:hypothetical protein [Streptosporangiaceae bacterium]
MTTYPQHTTPAGTARTAAGRPVPPVALVGDGLVVPARRGGPDSRWRSAAGALPPGPAHRGLPSLP